MIPGLGRSPGAGHGNPLQYVCLENPTGRGAWRDTVHKVAKSWKQLKGVSTHKINSIQCIQWMKTCLCIVAEERQGRRVRGNPHWLLHSDPRDGTETHHLGSCGFMPTFQMKIKHSKKSYINHDESIYSNVHPFLDLN